MTYECKSSHVAAFLNFAGLVLLAVKLEGKKVAAFVFDDPESEAEQLVEDFWADRKVTSARRLLQCFKEVNQEVRRARQKDRTA